MPRLWHLEVRYTLVVTGRRGRVGAMELEDGLRRVGELPIRTDTEPDLGAALALVAVSDINLFVLASLVDLRGDALRLHLTLQDDPHYAERRQAVLRRKVEPCADTFSLGSGQAEHPSQRVARPTVRCGRVCG